MSPDIGTGHIRHSLIDWQWEEESETEMKLEYSVKMSGRNQITWESMNRGGFRAGLQA
jgi:hypothetical protein